MSLEMINFGDVFLKDEKEYIFLAGTIDDYIYAIRVLDRELSKRVEDQCNRIGGSQKSLSGKKIFYWVKLTSKNLEDRLAHFHTAEDVMSMFPYSRTGFKLNDEDKEEILKQIKDPSVDLPADLKDLVKDISI